MKKRDDYSQYSKAMLGRIKTKSGIAFLIAMHGGETTDAKIECASDE